MVSLDDFIKERKDRLINNKWHKNDIYFEEESFLKAVKENEYKVGRAMKTVKELKQLLLTDNSDIHFSECDENLIVLGRANDYIDRDYVFYVNAQNALNEIEIENSFFINYTGHCGPVGAVLAKKGVPLIWNLYLENEAFVEKRIVEQIQDYYFDLESKPKSKNSLGLMLECQHGEFEPFVVQNFPTIEFLKEKNIKDVYIFVEMPADVIFLEEFDKYFNDNFKDYVFNLKKEFLVKFVPIDEKKGQENLKADKEKIKNPELYYSNFKCKRVL